MKKNKSTIRKFFFLILLQFVFIGGLFSICNHLPEKFIKLRPPTTEYLADFVLFVKDSLHQVEDINCRIGFHIAHAYVLRRLDKRNEALGLLDSLSKCVELNAYPASLASFLNEKIAILFITKEAKEDYNSSLTNLKRLLVDNSYFQEESDFESIISVSIANFSDAGWYEFANELILKQLESALPQDSFGIMHSYFMLGVNDLNHGSYFSSYEYLSKSEDFFSWSSRDSAILSEILTLKGLVLAELDSMEEASSCLRAALQLSDVELIDAYANMGLANIFEELNQIDSLESYSNTLRTILTEGANPVTAKNIYFYLSIVDFYNNNQLGFYENKMMLLPLIDTNDYVDIQKFEELALMESLFSIADETPRIKFLNYKKAAAEADRNYNNELMQAYVKKYETERKEQQITILRQKNELQQSAILRRNSYLVGISLGTLGLGLALILLFQKRQREKELFRNSVKRLKSDNANLITKNLNLKKPILENRETGQDIFQISNQDIAFNVKDIVYISSSGNYIDIFLLGQRKPITIRYTLQDYYQDFLNENQFFRIHRQYVVNLNRISKLTSGKVHLSHDERTIQLNVGRTYKLNVQDKFNSIAISPSM